MSDNKPGWGFWVVGVIALLWNLAGLAAFISQMTMTPEDLAALPADSRMLYEGLPAWVAVAFGLAVIGGVIGSVLLLMRRQWAVPAFLLSLVGVLAQNAHSFFMSNTFEVLGNEAMVLPLMVVAIAIGLVFWSRHTNSQGWLT